MRHILLLGIFATKIATAAELPEPLWGFKGNATTSVEIKTNASDDIEMYNNGKKVELCDLYLRAYDLEDQEDFEGAKKLYLQAYQQNANIDAGTAYAELLLNEGKDNAPAYAAGKLILLEIISHHNDSGAQLALSHVMKYENNYDEALRLTSLSRAQGNKEAKLYWGIVQYQMGNYEKAIEEFFNLDAENKDDGDLILNNLTPYKDKHAETDSMSIPHALMTLANDKQEHGDFEEAQLISAYLRKVDI